MADLNDLRERYENATHCAATGICADYVIALRDALAAAEARVVAAEARALPEGAEAVPINLLSFGGTWEAWNPKTYPEWVTLDESTNLFRSRKSSAAVVVRRQPAPPTRQIAAKDVREPITLASGNVALKFPTAATGMMLNTGQRLELWAHRFKDTGDLEWVVLGDGEGVYYFPASATIAVSS